MDVADDKEDIAAPEQKSVVVLAIARNDERTEASVRRVTTEKSVRSNLDGPVG